MIKDHNLVPNEEARLGAIQRHKLQALGWWAKDTQHRGLEIIVAAWTAAEPTSSIMHINIESLLGRDIKVAHPGKVEIGHKWTTWVVKWGNYIGSMVGVLGIPLGYVMCSNMPVGWKAENEQNHLKYQPIQIDLAWEYDKMAVYTDLKACCLD